MVPSVGCSVWDAQCKVPSVWCPVPSQGSLLDPRSQAQKGRLVRKARPSQAAGLPHFARVRTGLFPFIFLFQDLSCQLLYFNSSPDSEFFSQNSPVHFPWWWFILPVVHPSGLSLLWKCFPAPTSNKYWKHFLSWATIPYHTIPYPFLGDRTKNNGGQREGWSPATWRTRRPKVRRINKTRVKEEAGDENNDVMVEPCPACC